MVYSPKSFLEITENGNPKNQSYKSVSSSDYRKRLLSETGTVPFKSNPEKDEIEVDLGEIRLNLPPTPISFFPYDELIIYSGDIYHPSPSPEKNGRQIRIGGTYHTLVRGDSLIELEREYLNQNKGRLEEFQDNYLKRIAEGNSQIKDRYEQFRESLSRDSLDSLVTNYFFPITNNMDLEEIISENERKEKMQKKTGIEIPEIRFEHEIPLLDIYLREITKGGDVPLLITGEKVYSLSSHMPVFKMSLASLDEEYRKILSDIMIEKLRKNVADYVEELSSGKEILADLRRKINLAVSRPGKNFDVEKINDDESVLIRDVREYGVEWNGKFYLFPPVRIGVSLARNSLGYTISGEAFVYKNPEYKHPYCQGEKGLERRKICSAGNLSRIHSQINFIRRSESREDKAQLMKSAKLLLMTFEKILTSGHNSRHKPFDSIEESARFLSADEAEFYKRRGISFFPKTNGS